MTLIVTFPELTELTRDMLRELIESMGGTCRLEDEQRALTSLDANGRG